MIFLLIAIFVFLFAFVVLFGAPYLPTKKKQVALALEMLEVRKGKTIVDLGSGDGVFLLAAARRGATVYGYELNPLLCLVAKLRCWRYRQQVHISCSNFWRMQLPQETTGVYTFLLTRFMRRLDQKLEEEATRLGHAFKLASFTFAIPGRQAEVARDAVFLYTYAPKKQ
jgi:SAM-dependent methyltransferase